MILTTGSAAFKNPQNNDKFFQFISQKNYDSYWEEIKSQFTYINLTTDFKKLFWKMISYEPSNRPTIDEILEDPWFKEINDMKKNNLNEFKELEKK